jgi:hypothetical protein
LKTTTSDTRTTTHEKASFYTNNRRRRRQRFQFIVFYPHSNINKVKAKPAPLTRHRAEVMGVSIRGLVGAALFRLITPPTSKAGKVGSISGSTESGSRRGNGSHGREWSCGSRSQEFRDMRCKPSIMGGIHSCRTKHWIARESGIQLPEFVPRYRVSPPSGASTAPVSSQSDKSSASLVGYASGLETASRRHLNCSPAGARKRQCKDTDNFLSR